MKKLILSLTLISLLILAITACDGENPPDGPIDPNEPGDSSHVFKTEWASDDEKHWLACIDLSCDARKNEADHTFGEWVLDYAATCAKEGSQHHICIVCGKSVSETIPTDDTAHNYTTEWTSGDDKHWHACQNEGCAAQADSTAHSWNSENVCTICYGYKDTGMKFQKQSDGTYAVSDYTGSASEAIIPSTYHGAAVTTIGKGAFFDCTNLTSITIPDSVATIGEYAFRDCTSLTSINIPDGVTTIGSYAFLDCTSLTSITIPDSVTTIDYSAFSYCTSLMSITIPDSVTTIGSNAFSHCTSLTSITIPDSVTTIGSSAFSYCTSLMSITIPDSVTTIGSYAFSGCTRLASIHIPESVTSCANDAFRGCTGLASITVDKGNPKYHSAGNCLIETSSKTLVSGCKNSIIPTNGSVTIIGSSAFYECTSLTSITIPDSVTTIGFSAFYHCTSLMSITIPDSVTAIDNLVFAYCKSLTSITIPASVTTIGDFAFYGCSFTSITIHDRVTSLGKGTFGCTSLMSITVESGNPVYHSAGNCLIETASKTLVSGCKNSIIPTNGSVTTIGECAFSNCTGLTSINIPNSVTTIGREAFSGCTSLTSITIPDSVTTIGNFAFLDCTGLTSITFKGTKAQWNNISKGSGWNNYTPTITVTCTDGTVTENDS